MFACCLRARFTLSKVLLNFYASQISDCDFLQVFISVDRQRKSKLCADEVFWGWENLRTLTLRFEVKSVGGLD